MTGADLRMRRTELGYTQAELGRLLGVAPNTIARWERDEMTIQSPEMVTLALDGLENRRRCLVEMGTDPVSRIGPASRTPARLATLRRHAERDRDRFAARLAEIERADYADPRQAKRALTLAANCLKRAVRRLAEIESVESR